MENRVLKVAINHHVVHEETVPADNSMMRGHQLRKIFCIDMLKAQCVWAVVTQHTADGVSEVHDVQMEGSEIIVQSKMNSENFIEGMDWFDDKIFK